MSIESFLDQPYFKIKARKELYDRLYSLISEKVRAAISEVCSVYYSGPLHDFHTVVPSGLTNEVRYKAYADINSVDIHELIYPLYSNVALEFLGPDLAVQRSVNLSIVPPQDKQSVLPFHSDINTGESLYQIVVWIPFTLSFSTNSLFIVDRDTSLSLHNRLSTFNSPAGPSLKHEESKCSKHYLEINPSELLFFSPILYHGSDVNKTNITRISVNFRIKSYFTPYTHHDCEGKGLDGFYIPYKLSPLTRLVNLYNPPLFA
jgi:sporadic carbohydrate cluster 2OG-Fe(II) oxygenase